MANNKAVQPNDDDKVLVEQAKSGDKHAIGELFVRYSNNVRRLLRSVVGNSDEIDDLVQDVFIQVFRSLPGFRGDARFTTWLHQVTVYAAYNYLRKARKRHTPTSPTSFNGIESPGCDSPHNRMGGREAITRLNVILDTIKPKKRIAFVLFAVEGYSVNEVAEMVKAPLPTVKSRIWFARRELRKKASRDPYLGPLLEELVEDEIQ